MKYFIKLLLFVGSLSLLSCSSLTKRDTYPHLDLKKWQRTEACCESTGKNIAISSGGTNSTECGKQLLEQGGNIVDAAVATAFCLAVERPQSVSIAGGGFMLIHLRRPSPKTLFIDFRETAPASVSPKLFGENSPKDGNGLLVATPGFVAGLYRVHKSYGALKGQEGWAKVVEPSVRLAEAGFTIYPSLSEKIEIRKEGLKRDEYLKSLFFNQEEPLKTGDRLVQKDLARTLKGIGIVGPKAFYEGEVAKAIVQQARSQGGVLNEKDLRSYSPKERKPLSAKIFEKTVVTAPPPSSGGIQVLQILKAMERVPNDQSYLATLAKAFRTSFSERYEEVSDPDFKLVNPMKKLELKAYEDNQTRKPKIESPDTTHLSLIDSEGNAVSATISQNYFFGAAIGVPGTGILLNDQMSDFSLDGKNRLNLPLPKHRPLSNMSPTIVFEKGRPVLVLGAAGGPQIVTGVSQVILNRFRRGMSLKESVFASRIHHHFNPDKLFPERNGFTEEELRELKAAGFEISDPSSYSQVNAVEVELGTGQLRAVSEPRDEGANFCRKEGEGPH